MHNKLKSAALALVCSLAASAAFANTTTTNYSLNKPSVGADADNWGTLTNSNWDALDSIIFGIQGTANAACPKAGCTFTGGISGTTASFSGASSFGSTLGVTGLLSANGGESITGNLSVSGATTLTGTLTTSNSLVVGGTAIFGNGFGSNSFAAFVNGSTPTYLLAAGVSVSYAGGGLFLSNGSGSADLDSAGGWHVSTLYVNTGLSLPANSVLTTALAGDIGGTATYSCGSATTSCLLGFDSKGLLTNLTSTPITPDNCGSNANGSYCKNAEGYVHEWGSTASLSGGATVTITLPFTCPSSLPIVNTTPQSGGTNGGSALPLSTSQFSLTNNKSSASNYNWAADCN